jgi:hypothetical protein
MAINTFCILQRSGGHTFTFAFPRPPSTIIPPALLSTSAVAFFQCLKLSLSFFLTYSSKLPCLFSQKKAYRGCTLLEESGQNYHDSLQLGKQNRDMQCNLVALTAMKLQVKILIILLQMIFKILIIT